MSKFIAVKKEDTRPCLIRKGKEWEKAFFHMWFETKARYIDEPKKVLLAVVESENGDMFEVRAGDVKFTDRT